MLGVLLADALDALGDPPPPPFGLTISTMMIAISATASSATIAMRGQVQAFLRRGVGVSEVGGSAPPTPAAPEGSSRVAAVPIGVVYEAKAFSPAIPGT